jgi:hypothetical protein
MVRARNRPRGVARALPTGLLVPKWGSHGVPPVGGGCVGAAGVAAQVVGGVLGVKGEELNGGGAVETDDCARPGEGCAVGVGAAGQDQGLVGGQGAVEHVECGGVPGGRQFVEAVEQGQDEARAQQVGRQIAGPVVGGVREGDRGRSGRGEAGVGAAQLVGHPGFQGLVGVPGSQGEQHRHGGAWGAACDEVLQQSDQQHALASSGFARSPHPGLTGRRRPAASGRGRQVARRARHGRALPAVTRARRRRRRRPARRPVAGRGR